MSLLTFCCDLLAFLIWQVHVSLVLCNVNCASTTFDALATFALSNTLVTLLIGNALAPLTCFFFTCLLPYYQTRNEVTATIPLQSLENVPYLLSHIAQESYSAFEYLYAFLNSIKQPSKSDHCILENITLHNPISLFMKMWKAPFKHY